MKPVSKAIFVLANVALVVIVAIGLLTTFAQAQDDDTANLTQANVARSDALIIAETEVDSPAVSIELERENGVLIYSIHTANRQEIDINALDGSVIAVEPPHDHCEDDDEFVLGEPTITLVEAMTTAETEGGSPAVSGDLEMEGGVLVYSVDLNDGQEINVNALDGAIISVENDMDETFGLDDDQNESSGSGDDMDENETSGLDDDQNESSGSGECLDSDDDDNESSGSQDDDNESSGADDDENESSGSGD